MRIALAQINTTVGAIARNADLAIATIARARDAGADLVVFPELTLPGYPPLDLLNRRSFVTHNLEALERLAAATAQGPAVIVGFVQRRETETGKDLLNAAALCDQGQIRSVHGKSLLPTYDVFDEARYFDPAPEVKPAEFNGFRIGLSICEDIWNDAMYWRLRQRRRQYDFDPIKDLARQGVDFLINIAASPFTEGKRALKHEMFSATAKRHGLPLVHVNLVGGNDNLIFDGASNVFDSHGQIVAQASDFQESLLLFDIETVLKKQTEPGDNSGDAPPAEPENSSTPALPLIHPGATLIESTIRDGIESVCEALILGIRDYVHKCGFRSVILGLSGGIDSAVTAALAVRALGKEQVHGVAMPSHFSSNHSVKDAQALAENLEIDFQIVPIKDVYDSYLETLKPVFKDSPFGVAEENLQARTRGNILMAFANKFGHLLLSTGNKSEMAVGYCTLYGDMSGGLAVLSDVPKVMVYELAHHLNRGKEVIPRNSIAKPPSAELRPNQKDSDSLPPYDILDPIIRAYVEEGLYVREITERGYDGPIVERVISMIERNEYKRRQAPIGLKVTHRAFGYGRRIPVARGRDLG